MRTPNHLLRRTASAVLGALALLVLVAPAGGAQTSDPVDEGPPCPVPDGWTKVDGASADDQLPGDPELKWSGTTLTYDTDGGTLDLCIKSGNDVTFVPAPDSLSEQRGTWLGLTGSGTITASKQISHVAWRYTPPETNELRVLPAKVWTGAPVDGRTATVTVTVDGDPSSPYVFTFDQAGNPTPSNPVVITYTGDTPPAYTVVETAVTPAERCAVDPTADVTIVDGVEVHTFVNECSLPELGSVSVVKTVDGDGADAPVLEGFSVTLRCVVGDEVVLDEALTLTEDVAVTFDGLPAGAVCTATETARPAAPGATQWVDGLDTDEGTVAEQATLELVLENELAEVAGTTVVPTTAVAPTTSVQGAQVLPVTGSSTGVAAGVAALALAVGGALLLAARRPGIDT